MLKKGPRGKRAGKKKDKSKVRCYNCSKLGRFARECTESKKVRPNYTLLNYALVTSSVLLTESRPVWIVDSRATDHIARDRDAYVEYRRISQGSRWIYVCNNSRVEAKGIGTCKLTLCGGRILLLHDVLYAPEIRRNLISIRKGKIHCELRKISACDFFPTGDVIQHLFIPLYNSKR